MRRAVGLACALALCGCNRAPLEAPDAATVSDAAAAIDAAAPRDLARADLAAAGCGVIEPSSATVKGQTPLGAFEGRRAWGLFVKLCGCNWIDSIAVTGGDRLDAWPMGGGWAQPTLVITGTPAGTHTTTVTMHAGGQTATAQAVVTITELVLRTQTTPALVRGAISVMGGGWSLTGTFTASECPLFGPACLC